MDFEVSIMRIRLFAALALLGASAPAVGQESPMEPPKTGSVAGVVIQEKSEEGIAKALVILRRDQEGGVGAITGPDGKFTLRDVDPGTYVLTAERDGYVVARGQSQTVQVQAGQTTADLKLKLQRTGAVSGRILDADGDPVPNVSVLVSSVRGKDDRSANRYGATNDRGEYRIFQIVPGGYRLSATYSPRSRFDGVRIQPAATAGAAPVSGGEAYPTVYYPGLTDSRQAGVVKVEPGADLQGLDLQLVRTHGVRVRGRVAVSYSPAPLFLTVDLAPISQRETPGQLLNVLVRDPKGEFEFQGVLPGSYRLQVQALGLDEASRMSAHRALEVGASDIEGIEVTLAQPQSVSGRIVAPEGRKLPAGFIVLLQTREAEDTQAGGMAQAGADGAFTMPKVAPGEYDVVVASTAGGEEDDTYVDAIRMGDADALAEGIRVGEGSVPPIDIVLKANGGAAECTVKDDKGAPVPNASVLLAPDAPRQRQAALFGECRARADGVCKIAGIKPGEYHLYAFPAGTQIDRRDPGALKPFEKYGEAMTFAEGERKQVNLKMAPIE
jgi:protocatechuate 3,4-dioxygenase beta subunit